MQERQQKSSVPLFLLAGQSNLEGFGLNRELPKQLISPMQSVRICCPNRFKDGRTADRSGHWAPLEPGFGYGVRQEGSRVQLSGHFGPELAFAERLLQSGAGQTVALFKYAKSGSSLHPETADDWGSWDPSSVAKGRRNQWSHFSHYYKLALERWQPAGGAPSGAPALKPAGLIWVQGESDAAYTRKIAQSYAPILQSLIRAVRFLTGEQTLPVIIAPLPDSGTVEGRPALPWAGLIRAAQHRVAESDPDVYLSDPLTDPGRNDPWHYDSATCLKLGRQLADRWLDAVSSHSR